MGKLDESRQMGRLRRRRGNSIKMGIKEKGREGVEWTGLVQDWEKWRGVVNTVMKLRVPKGAGNFLTVELFDYGGFCYMGLVSLVEVLWICSKLLYPLFRTQIFLLEKRNVCLVLQIKKLLNTEGVIYTLTVRAVMHNLNCSQLRMISFT